MTPDAADEVRRQAEAAAAARQKGARSRSSRSQQRTASTSRARRTASPGAPADRAPRGAYNQRVAADPALRRAQLRSAPRRRQRRAAGAAMLLVICLVVVGAIVAGAWIANRPVSVRVKAQPSDARIDLARGLASARGSIEATGLAPGTYAVTVSRTGFETRTVSVEARRFRGGSASIALAPLPQRLLVSAAPDRPTISVFRGEKRLLIGKGKVSGNIPAGPVRIVCQAKGRNTYEREFFLDRSKRFSFLLDPEGQIVHCLDLVKCSGAPKGVALTPSGKQMWTTILNGPPSIEVFSTDDGRRQGGVDLGQHGAVEIVFNKAGTLAYASQMETARVFEIDARKRTVLRSFDTESAWTKVVALAPDEKTLYAANWSGDDVSEIDLDSGKLRRRIQVADTPRGLWPTADGKRLFVAGFGDGSLQVIDLESGDVKTLFKSGGALRHLVADEKRKLLYASDMALDCVWVCKMSSGEVEKFVQVGHKPNTIDLSSDGRVLFVSNRGENNAISYYLPGPEWGSVMLIDTKTKRVLDGVVGGNQCTALDVSDDGDALVFSDFLDDTLRVYRIPSEKALVAGDGGRANTLAHDVRK